jgi:hypothetical protein
MRVFENRVPRRILGSKGDEMVGGWRKPHNGELHNLYSSSNKIRIIKSMKMRCSWHVALMERRKIHMGF